MASSWVNFATTGDPNGEGRPEWPAYTEAADEALEFGDQVAVRAGIRETWTGLLRSSVRRHEAGAPGVTPERQMTRYRLLCCWTFAVGLAIGLAACAPAGTGATVEDAEAFVRDAETRLVDLWIDAGRAAWVQQNFISTDTTALAAAANAELMAATTELASAAARFNALDLPESLQRQLLLLRTSLAAVAPSDPALQQELSEVMASMESAYGQGEYCVDDGEECLDLPTMERMFADVRDTDELLDIWAGWRARGATAPSAVRTVRRGGERRRGRARLRRRRRHVALGVRHAAGRVHGRARAALGPGASTLRIVALSGARRTRRALRHGGRAARRADSRASRRQYVESDLGQHLRHRRPRDDAGPGYDLTRQLERNRVDALEMVRYGERFFSSLGFAPLPETFWERSLFVQPADRDVVCHASAWSLDFKDDVRIKMCIGVNDEDFVTIHHELGHNYYQRAYNVQNPLYQTSANDGFHEGIGDTIALSITPEYLVKVGLLNRAPSADNDIGLLLRQALDKIAFLPFGLLVDQWRWKVFSGEIAPEEYNQRWWDLRQGVPRHPAGRTAERGGLRSGRQVPRAGQHPLHAILPRAHSPVPVPPRAVRGGRRRGATAPLLDLRE